MYTCISLHAWKRLERLLVEFVDIVSISIIFPVLEIAISDIVLLSILAPMLRYTNMSLFKNGYIQI